MVEAVMMVVVTAVRVMMVVPATRAEVPATTAVRLRDLRYPGQGEREDEGQPQRLHGS
jgi:hypothetical protein